MPIDHRPYDPARDREAVTRIWREAGWIDADDTEQARAAEFFIEAGRGLVADLAGAAECLVVTVPGTLRYLEAELALSVVAAVTTSHVARRRSLAGSLTAAAVAADAAEGAAVSALGMFEQGFYDRIGFGTGSPTPWRTLDPADLRLPPPARPPVRLDRSQWEEIHANRLTTIPNHGVVTIESPAMTRGEMMFSSNAFGLGYRDEGGTLTHHLWAEAKAMEHGPLTVPWMAYRSYTELLELLGVIASLGDQYHAVRLQEPPGIQLQDLLRNPFRSQRISRRSEFETSVTADPYWQMRICELDRCLEVMELTGPDIRFNLRLEDPIAAHLDDGGTWRGIGGDYVVHLGEGGGGAEPGTDPTLPVLEASVGALTRWWLGVLPAHGLAVTDSFRGPAELLQRLGAAVRLPVPRPVWDF